jgi:hypothetical protein
VWHDRHRATCRSGVEAVGFEPTRRLPTPPGFHALIRAVQRGPARCSSRGQQGRMVRPLLPADESVRRIGSQFGSQSAVVDLLIHSRRRRSDGAGEVCELRRQAVVVLARPLWSARLGPYREDSTMPRGSLGRTRTGRCIDGAPDLAAGAAHRHPDPQLWLIGRPVARLDLCLLDHVRPHDHHGVADVG